LLPQGHGWVVCCVVVVVETSGGGVAVVVWSVVLVRVTVGGDPAQPTSIPVPTIIATPTAKLKRDVVLVIDSLPGVRAGDRVNSDRTTRINRSADLDVGQQELLGAQMTGGY
jgi:hypothetical protein